MRAAISAGRVLAAVALVLVLAAPVAVLSQDDDTDGYLDGAAIDIISILPRPPVPGSAEAAHDREVFRATRRLVGTARYRMATADVEGEPEDMLRDFSCAAGMRLTPRNAPRTLVLMSRAEEDVLRMVDIAKYFYKRRRPYVYDKGQICQPRRELSDSYDYPSGHAAAGWTWAFILADLLPDRAAAIRARGRAYGESRIVCGAHNASAVEASRIAASAILAVARATRSYQSDFAAARGELNILRKTAARPDAATCQAEAALVAKDIFAK